MKRLFIILICTVLVLVSCGKADVIIRTDLENTRSSAMTAATEMTVMTAETDVNGLMLFVVNSSSKTFHISDECRHVARMSDKNKKIIAAHDASELIFQGYKPCSTCIGE